MQPYRAIGVLRDINERKKAKEMLKLKLEELSRSNEELEQFAYISSHDMKVNKLRFEKNIHL